MKDLMALSMIVLSLLLQVHTSNAFSVNLRSPISVGANAKNEYGSSALSTRNKYSRQDSVRLHMAKKLTNEQFWEQQRRLAGNMKDGVNEKEKEIKVSARETYRRQVGSLVSETFYFSILIFCAVWLVSPNPFTSISYFLGAILGTAYTYGLGKYVESLGGSAYDEEDLKGSGVGSARFAFLLLLFVFVGKFRTMGLQEIPAIMGFFTYQLSTLSQGLKDASAEDY